MQAHASGQGGLRLTNGGSLDDVEDFDDDFDSDEDGFEEKYSPALGQPHLQPFHDSRGIPK